MTQAMIIWGRSPYVYKYMYKCPVLEKRDNMLCLSGRDLLCLSKRNFLCGVSTGYIYWDYLTLLKFKKHCRFQCDQIMQWVRSFSHLFRLTRLTRFPIDTWKHSKCDQSALQWSFRQNYTLGEQRRPSIDIFINYW